MFAVDACDLPDGRYFRLGTSSDVFAADLPETTDLDLYLGLLCRQAGVSILATAQAMPLCNDSAARPGDWALLVQAGLNDIDQRCDAYLAWLDHRKRTGVEHQQTLRTRSATNSVLNSTGPGPGPIATVADAFGFPATTFTNAASRLLLEVEQATVQSLVLEQQKAFRATLPRIATSRAEAIHMLSSYLQLCTPMAIEVRLDGTMRPHERMAPRR